MEGSIPCLSTVVPPGADAAVAINLLTVTSRDAWIQQDQATLSMLISSLSEEVMHLAIGKSTSS